MTVKAQTQLDAETMLGKVPPQSVPVEEAVIGAILLDRDVLPGLIEFLEAKMFYNQELAKIYEVCLEINAKNKPVDLITVTEALHSAGELRAIGGPGRLTQLTDRIASSANTEAHARIIQEKWMKRELIAIGMKLVRECYQDWDVFDTLDELDLRLNETVSLRGSTFMSLEKAIEKTLERARIIALKGDVIIGVPISGIEDLEMLTGGACPGDFMVISGDRGSGKSSMFNNHLITCAFTDQPIYDWSAEMTIEARTRRMLSSIAGINGEKIRSGLFFSDEYMKSLVDKAVESIRKKTVYLDGGSMTYSKFKSTVVNLNRIHGIKLFQFDRLELFDLPSTGKKDEDEAKSVFTATARSLATTLGVTIIFGAQLRKSFMDNPGHKPSVADLRGTGAIGDNANKILFCYRPEMYGINEDENGNSTKGFGKIIVAKNNEGRTGEIDTSFKGTLTLWGDPFGSILKSVSAAAPSSSSSILTNQMLKDDQDIPF